MDEFQDPLQSMAASHVEAVYRTVDSVGRALERAAAVLVHCMLEGNKAIACGVARAEPLAHLFCATLVGTVHLERPALPAICIGSSEAVLAGEPGDAQARMLQALAKSGDVLVLIVPPGGERSALPIITAAAGRDVHAVLLRADGASSTAALPLAAEAIELAIPETDPQRMIECALVLLNCLAAMIEARLFGEG